MADDWQAGDLALCVKSGRVVCPNCGRGHNGSDAPPVGAVREVMRIGRCSDDLDPITYPSHSRCGLLKFDLSCGAIGIELRFRKIRPHARDAEDLRTIALLNGKREPANA